jgi:hypothetical protein
VRKALLAIAAFVALYVVWPYWTAWRLYEALSARDTAAFAQRVDWPSFRTNLKASLRERLRREGDRMTIGTTLGGQPGQLSFTLTPETIDQLINHYATPERLPDLLALEGLFSILGLPATEPAPRDKKTSDQPRGERRRVTWAFFSSPAVFEVHVALPQRSNERIVPILEYQGVGWMLTNIRFMSIR